MIRAWTPEIGNRTVIGRGLEDDVDQLFVVFIMSGLDVPPAVSQIEAAKTNL